MQALAHDKRDDILDEEIATPNSIHPNSKNKKTEASGNSRNERINNRKLLMSANTFNRNAIKREKSSNAAAVRH